MGRYVLIFYKKQLPFRHCAPTSKDVLCSKEEMTSQAVGRTDRSTLTTLLFGQVHIELQRTDDNDKSPQTFV
jgi:hypothetical protein